MWDLIVSVPDHCLSFYFSFLTHFCISNCKFIVKRHQNLRRYPMTLTTHSMVCFFIITEQSLPGYFSLDPWDGTIQLIQ